MANDTAMSDGERVDQISEAFVTIREACGTIQANAENIEDLDEDTVANLSRWAQSTSGSTYRWVDEDGPRFYDSRRYPNL